MGPQRDVKATTMPPKKKGSSLGRAVMRSRFGGDTKRSGEGWVRDLSLLGPLGLSSLSITPCGCDSDNPVEDPAMALAWLRRSA